MAGQTWDVSKLNSGIAAYYEGEMLRKAQQSQTRFGILDRVRYIPSPPVRMWRRVKWFWEDNVCGAVSVLVGKRTARDWDE